MTQARLQDYRLRLRLRVRWAEVDMQRIVFNPHYLMYVDTAFTEYWRALAVPYEVIPECFGGDLYVKKSTLEYHGSAELEDMLQIGMRCQRIGNSSLAFGAGVFRSGTLLVGGDLIYVFADPATQTSKPVPQVLRELITAFEAGESMLDLQKGNWDVVGSAAAGVRRTVFIEEMGLPHTLQEDAVDHAAVHIVVRNRLGLALATGRITRASEGCARLGCIAVLRAMRSAGLGRQVVQALLDVAAERGDREVVLSAQRAACGLYAALGFQNISAPYMESGLEHVDMKLELPAQPAKS